MKKVVLLAGALAAGMAAAPVTANAAPTLPGVQQINADYTDQDVENFYTAQHSHIDTGAVVVDDKKTAVNADTELDSYVKAQEVAALDALLTKYSDARLALEAAYATYSASLKNQGDIDAFFHDVENIADTYPTTDDLDEIDQNFSDFEADVELWDEYHKWFEGTSDYPPNDPNDTGMRDRGHKLYSSDAYKEVDETDDVKEGWAAYADAIKNTTTGFVAVLDAKPALVDSKSNNDVTANQSNIETSKTTLTNALTSVEGLVTLYHNDQTALLGTPYSGYAAEDAAADDDYKNMDGNFSTGYTAAVEAAQTAAKDYIETFDATDAATWRTGHTGEGNTFTKEADYKAGAEAKVAALGTVIGNAKANVTAYGKLKTVLDQAASDIATLRTTYWDKRKDGAQGADTVMPEEDRYVYRALILDLESAQSTAVTELTTAFNTADPSTDATSILGNQTAEQVYETLLQKVSDAQTAWAANETAHATAQEYLGTHTVGTDNAVEWPASGVNAGSLYNDRQEVIDHIDGYETVQVWDPTAEAYAPKDVLPADYNDGFTCEHDKTVLGLTALQNKLNDARGNHIDEYNNINLDSWVKTNLEDAQGELVGVAKEFGDNLALIANQAATDQAQLYTQRAQAELDKAKKLAEALDDQCEEARACDDADCGDAQKNPCGWHEATAAAALDAIQNTENGTIKTATDAIDADHDAETAGDATIAAAKAAGAAIEADIAAWKTLFDAADADHKAKLDNTKAATDNAIHKNIHEVIGTMRLDAANFETGDTKAADLWAQALTGLDLNLDGTVDHYDTFAKFVDALEAAEAIYTAKAQELYDKHFWTQLDALLQSIVGEGGLVEKCTYQQAVDTNRTARIVAEQKISELTAELEAAIATLDAKKVYSPETLLLHGITDLTGATNTYAVLSATTDGSLIKAAKDAIKAQSDALAIKYEAGQAKGFTLAEETVKTAIKAFNDAVDLAEAQYTANHEAYQALEAALTEFEAVAALAINAVAKAADENAIYPAEALAIQTTITNLGFDTTGKITTEHTHYTDLFKTAKLAEKNEEELGHLAVLAGKLKDVEDQLAAALANKVRNVEAYDRLYAQLAAVSETRTALDTEWEAAKSNVYEVEGHKDQTAVETKIAALANVTTLRTKLTEELGLGTILTNEGDLSDEIAALTNGIADVRALIAEKVKFFETEQTTAADLRKQVDDLEVLQQSLDTTWAVYDDIDNGKDAAALSAAYQAIREAIATERGAIATDLAAGNVQANADAHDTAIGDINDAIKALQDNVKLFEKFYADEHALAADYDKQVADLEVLQQSLDTTWAVYDDIDNGKDAAALSAAYQAIREAIQTERGAIATDLTNGNVQANADAHDTAIGDINDAIKTLQDNVKLFEKFYADEHALADKYNDELNNLETLRDALGTVWDAYDELTDSDQTLKVLHEDWQAITEDIAAERTAIADDLEAGHVQANATDHETALSDINDAIKTLQDKVRGIEEFKATNDKNYAALVEATKDLLASLDDVKYVSDDVYELLPATEAAADLDQESIEVAREAAKTLANTELTALETALAEGKLYSDSEVAAQQAKIDEVADALEALKEQVKAAEDFRRANAEANDKLEEKVQALVTIINTAKANSVCDLCNDEDTADLEAELDAVYEILGNVAESFAVGHLAMPMVTDNYAKYMQDLTGVEANVQATLDEIAEHKVRQINDQNAYNVLQKALVDVDYWLDQVQLEEGWENFKIRGAHLDPTMCVGVESLDGVKYFNELTDAVTNLKALIETQHSHEGGHVCEENKIDDMKAMKALIEDAKTLIEAIQANEAAHQTIKDRFAELFADAKDAYEFWNKYYSTATLITHEGDIANWIQEWNGELENGYALAELENLLHNSYVHGNAAYKWTVDGKGKELNELAVNTFTGYDEDLANDRNKLAHTEALNHLAQVKEVVDTYYNNTLADYTNDGFDDPFVKDVLVDWRSDVEGEYGLYASLNLFKADIEAAYEEGVMEDAINIDNHNPALGIHQQLDGVLGVLRQIEAEYKGLFADAHHLTNGKTLYSDMQYVTIGFFRKANEGLGEQATEMFKVVEPHFDAVEGNIGIYDMNWLESTPVDPTRGEVEGDDVVLPEFTQDILVPVRDAKDYLVHKEGLGAIPAQVGVLGHGDKKNELTFTLNDEYDREVVTLAAGPADITFKPGSLSVYDQYNNEWRTKHNVYIEVNVEAPQVEEEEADVTGSSNKLIVRLSNPIDLTYTINSLVAKTDNGTEFSYADREINYAKGQLEFTLPEGTQSVELPEGFFTFRTGENTIARSAAMVVAVGGISTSIESLVAMGEKAQIFDLQGRRVKAEALVSGNAYIVNGEKVMVK